MTADCPMCGPFVVKAGHGTNDKTGAPICPTCQMTLGEHAYRARILADSAAVYAQEAREFAARRAAERAA